MKWELAPKTDYYTPLVCLEPLEEKLWLRSVLNELAVLPACRTALEAGKFSTGDSLSQRDLAAVRAASQAPARSSCRTSACLNSTVSDVSKNRKEGGRED
ncbi:hypothetical protein MTO96_030339 [Rhipicephalus appendiculatus]